MSTFQVAPPWVSQIGLVRGCDRRCAFCGIRELKTNSYTMLSTDVVRKIATDMASWLDKLRIEFAMQGEPLTHPQIHEILGIFRTKFHAAQLLVTTNSGPLKADYTDASRLKNPAVYRGPVVKERVQALFDAGLHTLLVNDYDLNNDLIRGLQDAAAFCGVPYFDYFEARKEGKPVNPWSYRGTNHKEIVVMRSWVNHQDDMRRNLNNQAGNAPNAFLQTVRPLKPVPMMKRCQIPFRELEIKPFKHDYTNTGFTDKAMVEYCCMSWKEEAIVDFFPEKSLKQIWESERFVAVRKILYEKQRAMLPMCSRCDYSPYKVGLLKDPMPDTTLSLEEIAKIAHPLSPLPEVPLELKTTDKL